jgi:hypothetical protein
MSVRSSGSCGRHPSEVRVRALEDAIVVAFLINPKARATHAGTIGH